MQKWDDVSNEFSSRDKDGMEAKTKVGEHNEVKSCFKCYYKLRRKIRTLLLLNRF